MPIALVAFLVAVGAQSVFADWVEREGYIYREDPDCAWMDVEYNAHNYLGEVWTSVELDVYDSGGFFCDEQWVYWPGGLGIQIQYFVYRDVEGPSGGWWECDHSPLIYNPEWQHYHDVHHVYGDGDGLPGICWDEGSYENRSMGYFEAVDGEFFFQNSGLHWRGAFE
ncbi:MAG: hypothetical protein GEU73_12200 [Chloroflexi bacterium]|nr:hypothetical protein [Chloroflexota bacterium]